MEVENIELTLVQTRIIQSMWETKAPEYIAWVLELPFALIERTIKELNKTCKVKLHERPQFTKKILQKQKDHKWLEKPAVKIADHTSKVSVRIDAKTVVFVTPGTDIEKYKKNYLANKLSALKKTKNG